MKYFTKLGLARDIIGSITISITVLSRLFMNDEFMMKD